MKGTTLKENLRSTIHEIRPLQSKPEMNINADELVCENSDEQLCHKEQSKWRRLLPQIFVAVAVSWVSLGTGYIAGYTSPAGESLKNDLQITELQFSWISGIMPLAALVGGLLGGPSIEYLGRKWSLLITNTLLLIGWLVNYFAQHYWYMYVSRMIAGCGVGLATLTMPVYLGETIQPEIRGTLALLPTAFGNIGILICFSMGSLFEWKGIAGIGVLLSVPFLVLVWIMPETPYWFISKGNSTKSLKSLTWLRGKKNTEIINSEFAILPKVKISYEENGSFLDLFKKSTMKPLAILLGLMFFQQLSGINAVIFYTTQIFNDTHSEIDSSTQTIIVGAVNFIATFIAVLLIDRLGRKILLYISSVAMIITLGVLGTYFFLLNYLRIDITAYGWIPLASCVIYVLGFSFGFGPVPWLMMGEILPAKVRGTGASVSTAFNWLCTCIVTTTFPLLREVIGSYAVFWLFGVVTVLALVFIIFCVPETRGKSLEDIENKFSDRNYEIN